MKLILKLPCLILFLVFSINSIGQSAFKKHNYTKNYQINNKADLKQDSIINLKISQDSIELAIHIIHQYSLDLYKKKRYNSCLKYADWEKKLYEKNNIFNKDYIQVIFNQGIFYDKNLEYHNALLCYKEVIKRDEFNYMIGYAYLHAAIIYYRLGYYEKAIDYNLKRINYLAGSENYNGLVSAYMNISQSYISINTPQAISKSLTFLRKAEELNKANKIAIDRLIDLQNSLGQIHINEYNYNFDKARYYHSKNLKLGLKFKDSTLIARSYTNLAFAYSTEGKDSVKFMVSEGLKYALYYPEAKARLHDNLADYQITKNKLKEAQESIHKSLEVITKTDIHKFPTDYQISESILRDYTLYCLKKKVEIYLRLYQRDKNKSDLVDALANVERSEYTIDLLLNGTSESSTQMLWRREASQAYLYGAYAAHLLGDPEQAFSFMEKNKALLLSEGVLKNTEFANLPRHISQQETAFQKQIYELENKLSKDENSAVLQDSLFNAKRVHENYIDSLKTVYPKYFARKIDVDQIPLSEVQKELGTDDAVLSYIWNDFDRDTELIIGMISTKDQAKTFEIKNTKDLRQKIQTYRTLISKPFDTKEEQNSFKSVAYELYTILLPNEDVRDLVKGKNLTIIPDGDLQNIPFESLIIKEDSNEYLILNGDVNYSYSYSFLKHNEKVNRKTTQDFVGYSPSSFEALSLTNLTNTKEEVLNINKELDGTTKLQDTATKNDFLTNSSNAKIIHLATHADVGKNPWIAFSDEKLELHELYTYKNNADLVTLSACNTSLGELAKGEGVLSLARGFFYSGSKSVVSSLWEVNDKSTSEIMTDFYKNLKKGQTKSEAINNAKRDYITNHSLSEKSPYYWSSFILIGDAGTINLTSNLYLYLITGLLLLVIILLFRKKIKISG